MAAGGNGRLWAPLLAAALLAFPLAPAAQTVCRPTTLGAVRCQGPLPAGQSQWPLYERSDGRPVIGRHPDAAPPARRTIPAWRTDSFGNTRPGTTELMPRPRRCLPDRLGRLRCL